MIVLNIHKVRKCISRLRVKALLGLTDKEAIQLTCLEMLLDNQLMDGELY